MAVRNYTKNKAYGKRLTNEAKAHMVDATSDSLFVKQKLGKEPVKSVSLWHVTKDGDGNRFVQIAEVNQSYGGKAFTTPQGGLGRKLVSDKVIEAAKENGMTYGDENDSWMLVQTKGMTPRYEYATNEKTGKDYAVIVGYAPTEEQIDSMANNVKGTMANIFGLRDEKGAIDLSKLPEAGKAMYKRVLTTDVAPQQAKAATAEKKVEKKAEKAAEKPAEKKPARKQFTGKEFDVRKDTPGYDALKTAQHEPTDKANFLVRVTETGHVAVVNNPRANEPGGYINGTKGVVEALEAAGIPAIEMADGSKGYDIMANVEFGDKGVLSMIADSIEPRQDAISTGAGFARRFDEAKAQASANSEEFAAEKSAKDALKEKMDKFVAETEAEEAEEAPSKGDGPDFE